MAKKEPTSNLAEFLQEQAVPVAELRANARVETSAEAAVRQRIEENEQKKETLEKVKEELVASGPAEPNPALLEQARVSAELRLQAAKQTLKAAQESVAAAQKEVDDIVVLQSAVPQMTEDQRNRQYIESQQKLRQDAIKESRQRYEAMHRAGLLSDAELQSLCPTVTPLDRAISEQNMRKRAKDNRPVFRRI